MDIKVLYFDIEDLRYQIFIDSFGPCSCWHREAESECSLSTGVAEHRLQCRQFIATQFWRRISTSTLSGRRDSVAGEVEVKVASRMVQWPPVEQELIEFNRNLFLAGGSLFLVSYRTGWFVLLARWNALRIINRVRGNFAISSALLPL
jgi:hypothetical protein